MHPQLTIPLTYFITGIGTGVGKTLVAAVLAEALGAAYWKPVQAGLEEGTDMQTVTSLVRNPAVQFFPELYRLHTPASPHIAARMDGVHIDMEMVVQREKAIRQEINTKILLVEGAGGLLVPLNSHDKTADLVKQMQCPLILVSRNYLGSINHSLLTADYCRTHHIPVAGWIFTDTYLNYEDEIVEWSGYPRLCSIPALQQVNANTIAHTAASLRGELIKTLGV
jgi:dethiobiotin synthetase